MARPNDSFLGRVNVRVGLELWLERVAREHKIACAPPSFFPPQEAKEAGGQRDKRLKRQEAIEARGH